MKRLIGPSRREGFAGYRAFSVMNTSPDPTIMDGEEFQAIPTVAVIILLLHVIAAPQTDQKTETLRVIHIDPVAASPALVNPDVMIAVIDHPAESAFAAYRRGFMYRCHKSLWSRRTTLLLSFL